MGIKALHYSGDVFSGVGAKHLSNVFRPNTISFTHQKYYFWPECLHERNLQGIENSTLVSHVWLTVCVTSDMTIAFVRTYVHVLTPIDSSVALCSSRWEQPWCPVWKPWWFEAWATTRITRGRAKCYASVASKVGKVEHNECSTMTCTSLSFVNEQRGRLTKRLQRGRLKKEIEQGHIISSGRKTYRATLVTIVKKYSRVKQSVYTSTPSQTVDLLTLHALPLLTIASNAAPLRKFLRDMPLRI